MFNKALRRAALSALAVAVPAASISTVAAVTSTPAEAGPNSFIIQRGTAQHPTTPKQFQFGLADANHDRYPDIWAIKTNGTGTRTTELHILDSPAPNSPGNGGANGPVDPQTARAIGQQLAAARGWVGAQWTCLEKLWTKESGWRWNAKNPSSSAYGIPQALAVKGSSVPGSKMASAGADFRTNARTQITWGLEYIQSRYGTPCGAWNTWNARSPHWY